MPVHSKETDILAINTIRFLAVDAVQQANSGHPGMPMGCAPIAYCLYKKIMKHNPADPAWINRDRFILSAGHGSMLLYAVLHLSGYDLSIDDLKNFRQWESKTPGHPEYGLTPGVETTTGPLGQGFANAVGMALAQSFLAALFNKEDIKLIDHYIYGICSDGDLMEGISHEAAALAGHLKLNKLIFFYDDNGITIDGSTSLAYSDDVAKRFDAYHWHVQKIEDVNDTDAIERAVLNARNENSKPSLIITKTHIGFGSPNKQDTASVHGSPLGDEEVKLTKKNLGWNFDKSFYVPDEVKNIFKDVLNKGKKLQEEWNLLFREYQQRYPEDADKFKKVFSGNPGTKWIEKLPEYSDFKSKISTRAASGAVLNGIAPELPTLIGGSADLAPSNNTMLKGFDTFSADNRQGRNLHFGIREHGMASILNGMAIYGGVIPYGGTFLVFSDYLRPALRLASISKVKPILIFTHDSIGLGEDGPTHQPVEHLSSLRAIPGLIVIRPADANETVFAWKAALEHKGSPVAIILTRQNLRVLDRNKFSKAENTLRGAYVLFETSSSPDVILMASGSEVEIAVDAAELLLAENINSRVVSFPSWELFEAQPEEYRKSVLPAELKARVSIEAGVRLGWERYLGEDGESISIERFGASAPYKIIYEKLGLTPENVKKAALRSIDRVKTKIL